MASGSPRILKRLLAAGANVDKAIKVCATGSRCRLSYVNRILDYFKTHSGRTRIVLFITNSSCEDGSSAALYRALGGFTPLIMASLE